MCEVIHIPPHFCKPMPRTVPEPPTDEEWERLEAVEGLRNLCAKYGYARVARWVKNLAAIHGEEC